jgi:Flp pilus assembly protein TadG
MNDVRRRDDRGSMAVEVVMLTPVLMMFALLVVAAGRYVSVEGDIDAAARDAARAASLEDSRLEAIAAANRVVQESLDSDTDCAGVGFGGTWAAGGNVQVTLNCKVSYSGLGLIGLPGSVDIDSTSSVPLDPYRTFDR